MKRKSMRSKSIALIGSALLMLIAFSPVTLIASDITIPFVVHEEEHFGTEDSQLYGIVKDRDWLLVLGRAFFWDQQMGSDGGACANCHFSAGADNRLTGQMNPAFRAPIAPGGDTEFGCTQGSRCEATDDKTLTGSGGSAGPEYTFVEDDYPFRQLLDPNDRQSEILINSNDVHSSAGSFDAKFKKAFHGKEFCGKPNKDIFYKTAKHGHKSFKIAARAVEPRNTPHLANMGMLFTLFWDGRANNMFNGVGVFGMSDIHHDPNKRLIKMEGDYPELTYLSLKNSAAASLSVGPILDNLEMSCDGRTFADVARKILYTRPLRKQRIAETDSTFGYHGPKGDLRAKKKGLKGKYKYYKLIQLAFEDKWWKGKGLWKIEDGKLKKTKSYKTGHSQMEINFPMFWGLALQRYQHSLVSDQSRFDIAEMNECVDIDTDSAKFQQCVADGLWTLDEQIGRDRFQSFGPGNGGCAACHGGNMFTNAAMTNDGHFENMLQFGPSAPGVDAAIVDEGFQNTGANLFAQDVGRFGRDSYGYPVSFTRQLIFEQMPDGHPTCDPHCGKPALDPQASQCEIIVPGFITGGPPQNAVQCDANGNITGTPIEFVDSATGDPKRTITVGGTMKSPSLRNVGLTPPYFHYGGYSNLIDIMDFYARGGSNRNVPEGCTPTVNGPPGSPPIVVGDCTGDTSGNGPFGHQEFGDFDAANPGSNIGIATLDFSRRIVGRDAQGRPIFVQQDVPTVKKQIVKYMLSLSDPRVACDADVFDHPELIVFNGAKGKDRNWDYRADDIKVRIPAVGKEGYDPYAPNSLCIVNQGNLFAPGMGNKVKDRKRPETDPSKLLAVDPINKNP